MKQNQKRTRLGQLALLSPLVLSVSLSAACAKMTSDGGPLASKAGDTVGCQSFQESFWDGLYQYPQNGKPLPSEQEMHDAFIKATREGRLASLSAADQTRVSDALTELYRLLALDSVRELGVDENNSEETLSTLTALEIGDRTTDEKSAVQDKIQAEFAKIESIVKSVDSKQLPDCAITKPDADSTYASGTLFADWKSNRNAAVYGALKTFAVSYQSCDATGVSPLTTANADVDGIKIVGTHKDGVGSKREISSISSLVKSHPYLKSYKKPNSSCFDVSKSPLIYDYGGRPVTSSGAFDMFKNAGSGTSVLGTDCSGYVYMALATAGLKVKSDMTNRAVLVSGFSSTMYLDPKRNGMTCIDHAVFSGSDSLRPGDIIAKAGHVIIVGSVGSDPFGLANIEKASDCTTKNISSSKFNFTILQSSNSKGGIGIHAHKASSYLKESEVMETGLIAHAVNACKAKFGSKITTKNAKVSIVRHSGTSSCKSSEVKMERESCVTSCRVSGITSGTAKTAAVDDLGNDPIDGQL